MPWNNGYERKKFEEEQKQLAEEYRAAGMTEEQIHDMYLFDLAAFNSKRRYWEHNQQFPDNTLDDDAEGTSPLNDKFLIEMTVTMEQSTDKSRYWWIEELDNPALVKQVKKLSFADVELITMLVYEHRTQDEAAAVFGISQRAVSKRFEKLKKFLK